MAGVYRQAINSLEPDTLNSLVIGVIVSSLNARSFEQKSKYRVGTRGVWTFTLKDSEHDTINVTVWGSSDFINNIFGTFHIGSVIDVINPKVQARKIDEKNEMYTPSVTSLLSLTVNEESAVIQEHDGPDKPEYEALLKLPMKNISNVRSINSIITNIDNLQNQYVDILVAVTFVSEARNIMTKDGRSLICCDFECTDGSTQSTLALRLWEKEWVRRSGLWHPRQTVLFISDACITIDKFKKKLAIMIVRKTLITEDPNIPEAADVRRTVRTDSEYMPHDPYILPKPESIANVMTVKDITERLNNRKTPQGAERDQFLTVVYATVTEVNMSPTKNGILITRCALCKRIILSGQDSCMNLDCPCGNGSRRPLNVDNFYLKLNLKDKTGYLIGCRLTGDAAERALGCTVDQFKEMTQREREELKWKLTLEVCDVRLQVLGPTQTFRRALYNILSLSRISTDEYDEASSSSVS